MIKCLICNKLLTTPTYFLPAQVEDARKLGWVPVFLRTTAAAEWQCPECVAKSAAKKLLIQT